ncbi:MAG: zinc-binding dehydrogenase [Acidobacteriota bacterium]
MKAVVLEELGAASVLMVKEVPDPIAGEGEVVVRLKAAALNHRDVYIRQGLYAGIKLPAILGSDGAGVIAAVGSGVSADLVGHEVVIDPCFDWGDDERAQSSRFHILGMPDDGTYAEMIKIPAANAVRKPSGLSFEEAAAIPLAGLTAYRAVVSRARVSARDTVLVTGIGGGVAAFALQISLALGARVFVTSGSEDKLTRAKELGAEGGVNYHSPDWGKEIVALSGGGPDVVIDSVGGETFSKCLEILRLGGRLVSYGATTGAAGKLEIRRIFWKQLSVLGSTMGTREEFLAMLELYESKALRPVVDHVFPLDQAAEAHQRMEDAGQFGKIVLKT